jgi:hypothetical protein
MWCLCVCTGLQVCLRIQTRAHAHVYSRGLKFHLLAVRRCQRLREYGDLSAHCAFWVREHLAGITMFNLASRAVTWTATPITMPLTDDSCFASLIGLMEHRIWAGVKYLHHKLKHFAIWTDASFYNNFHLKLAQYIFNEFFYKTFNSPQFISSGKWLSSLKWWAGCCLYLHNLRRKSDFSKKKKKTFLNRVLSLWSHLYDGKTIMSANPLSPKDVIKQEASCKFSTMKSNDIY